MDNDKVAAELVRIAKELVSFKGSNEAQKLLDTVGSVSGAVLQMSWTAKERYDDADPMKADKIKKILWKASDQIKAIE